nr:MAG TPA: hypothetical protein [Caudoviricetes sp.]
MKTAPRPGRRGRRPGSTSARSRRCCGRPFRPYAAPAPWPGRAAG